MNALRQQQGIEAGLIRFALRFAATSARQRAEALIRSGFIHRFLVAAQEMCALKRAAMMRQLEEEQEAAVGAQRNKGTTEQLAETAQVTARLRTQHTSRRRAQVGALLQQHSALLRGRRVPRLG